AGESFCHLERFKNRAGIPFAAAQVVHLSAAWLEEKLVHKAGDILCVYIVAHLLGFVSKNGIFALFDVALDQVTEEAVQLHSGMVRTGQTAAAQTAGGHAEVTAILLNEDVGGNFRSAE